MPLHFLKLHSGQVIKIKPSFFFFFYQAIFFFLFLLKEDNFIGQASVGTWQKPTADALMPVSINVPTLIKVICRKVVIQFQKEQNNNVKKKNELAFLCHPYTQNIEEELAFL